MSWLYVLGLEGSNSGSDSRPPVGLERFVTWNGKPMSRLVLGREWRTGCLRLLRSTLTCEASTVERGVESWISFLRDTRASRSASPGTSSGQRTSGTFGLMCSACSASVGPGSLFSRMSEATSTEDCPTCSGTWPASGSMRNGTCSVRKKRARLTAARGCSYLPTAAAQSYGNNRGGAMGRVGEWPTPQARDWKGGFGQGHTKGGRDLATEAARWPTPTAGDAKGSGAAGYSTASGRHSGTTLTDAVKLWPTPQARDWKGGFGQGHTKGGRDLATEAARCPMPCSRDHKDAGENVDYAKVAAKGKLAGAAGGALNPTWVEWLMGFPLGYSALEPLEMESYRQWQLAHGVNSPKGH